MDVYILFMNKFMCTTCMAISLVCISFPLISFICSSPGMGEGVAILEHLLFVLCIYVCIYIFFILFSVHDGVYSLILSLWLLMCASVSACKTPMMGGW